MSSHRPSAEKSMPVPGQVTSCPSCVTTTLEKTAGSRRGAAHCLAAITGAKSCSLVDPSSQRIVSRDPSAAWTSVILGLVIICGPLLRCDVLVLAEPLLGFRQFTSVKADGGVHRATVIDLQANLLTLVVDVYVRRRVVIAIDRNLDTPKGSNSRHDR